MPLAELPHLASLAKKSRSGLVDGKSRQRAITFATRCSRPLLSRCP